MIRVPRRRSSTSYHREQLRDRLQADLAYASPGDGRFRVNIFHQRGEISVALRLIPPQVRTIRDLHPAAGRRADRRRASRSDPRHRHDRQRQEHDAGRDDRPHQPARDRTSSPSKTRSSISRRRTQSIINQREIGVRRAALSPRRCAARCARTRT